MTFQRKSGNREWKKRGKNYHVELKYLQERGED